MELTDYIRILRKRWWIIIVAVALTAGSSFAFSKLQPARYTSTAEIIIEPARTDWGLVQSAKLLLRTYMTVADSDQWAQDVIDRLQLSMTPEQLRSQCLFRRRGRPVRDQDRDRGLRRRPGQRHRPNLG